MDEVFKLMDNINKINKRLEPIYEISQKFDKLLQPTRRIALLSKEFAFPLITFKHAIKLQSYFKFYGKFEYIQNKNIEIYNKINNLIYNITNNSTLIFNDEIQIIDNEITENNIEIETLKSELNIEIAKRKNLETENIEKDVEIIKLKEYIKILETQKNTNANCTELYKLIDCIKRYPTYTTAKLAETLNKAESTINTQLKEICEKIYNIPEYENNKGIKRVRELVINNNIQS